MTLGKPKRRGHITKEGRRDVRCVMVEAGCRAVEHHPHWKAQFEHLTRRMGKQKAIVAIARKLLVAVWHVALRAASRHQCSGTSRCAQADELDELSWHRAWSASRSLAPALSAS
jgi:hypothetical protein